MNTRDLKSKIQKLKITPSISYLLSAGFLFRCFAAFWLFPTFDEAYYYVYSQNLDWSYFDHPVLVALTTGFGVWITGIASQFTIRWGTLILYTASLWLLYLTATKLFNLKAARLTLAIATIIPIFQIGFGVLTLPESPLIFFWSASLYCAASEFFRFDDCSTYQPSYRLAVLGILVGLACLSKYHGFILGLGLLGFCLTSPHHRRVWRSPWTGISLSLFILTLLPLLFWNWQHDWISFRFHLSTRFEPEPGVAQSGYSFLGVLGVFFAGIGYLFPSMGLPLWWVSWRSLLTIPRRFLAPRSPYDRDRASKHFLILWVSLPLMIGFTLLGGSQQVLPGWAMPGFWGVTLLLGERAFYWQKQSRQWVRWWLQSTAIVVVGILLLTLLHITTGTFQKPGKYSFLGGFVAPQNDASTELIDVRQLGQGFADSPVLVKALKHSSFVFTNAYYLGGIISMAIEPIESIPVTCFSDDPRGFAFWHNSQAWIGKDALYVTTERFEQMPWLTAEFRTYFRNWQKIATVPIRRGGVVTEVFHVYRGQNLLKPYQPDLTSKN